MDFPIKNTHTHTIYFQNFYGFPSHVWWHRRLSHFKVPTWPDFDEAPVFGPDFAAVIPRKIPSTWQTAGRCCRSAGICLVEPLKIGGTHTHRIHGAGIYANIGGILMVNVTIYSIYGSYGIWLTWTFGPLQVVGQTWQRKFVLDHLYNIAIKSPFLP